MKHSHRILIGGAAALLVGFFAWEWYLSPQARVARFIDRVAGAAEDEDTALLLSSFSPEYSDFRSLDYESLAGLIERGFERVDRLNITIEGVRVEVAGDQATAIFGLTVVAIRGEERYLLVGAPMQPEKLEVELRRESGEWKILSVAKNQPK